MRIMEFKYQKPGESTISNRKVVVLEETTDYLSGIDLDKLDKDERVLVDSAVATFQDAVSKVMSKAYRRFQKSSIR